MFRQIKDWAALWRKETALVVLIFFTTTFGFAVGYLARARTSHAPIIIEKCGEV